MSYQQDVFTVVSSIVGQNNIIPIQVEMVRFVGDYHTAALLTQLIYWQGKQKDRDGWIYKTYDEWEREIALTKYQASRSAKTLEKMGIIETKVKKINLGNGMFGNTAVHYKLNSAFFIDLFCNHLKSARSKETSLPGNKELHFQESSNLTSLPIYSETTVRNDDNVQPPAPEPSTPKIQPQDPVAVVDHIDDVFSHFVPGQYQKQSIKDKMNAALKKGHSKGYIYEAVLYTNDHCNGGSWQKYSSYIGKTLDYGWAIGYGQDITETESDRDVVRAIFKQMSDVNLKSMAAAGNSWAIAEIERRSAGE